MAPDTASQSPDDDEASNALTLSGRLSLTRRILLVNIVAVLLLAGSFFYLDGVRARLEAERLDQAQSEAEIIAIALERMPASEHGAMLVRFGRANNVRLRLFDATGHLLHDSWSNGFPTFTLQDPSKEVWQRHVARVLDDGIDFIVGAKQQPFEHSTIPSSFASDGVILRLAPDRTHVISTRKTLPDDPGLTLIMDSNARDIRRLVRAERSRLGVIIGLATLLSVLLSLFLARTIVRPIRRLARAAIRVKMGRAREVTVPRLPSRSDEIGMLARALSDMSQTLRQRIDASEAFAADVTHEIKNPLASLRSAVESLGRVKDAELQSQLLKIMDEDVRRLDRLITDIADLSRLDAQLTRVRFERIDLGLSVERLINDREAREAHDQDQGPKIAFARPLKNTAVVMGEESRLMRVVENLLDNAVSFSTIAGVVRIIVVRDTSDVVIAVEDDGPGIPFEERATIFERFHSYRPDEDAFGKHSGLGLSIAKTIVEGHGGTIMATERQGRKTGARIEIRLPAAAGDLQ
jgi:two-component system, OmpR family, sensor histidine kinase ChvG